MVSSTQRERLSRVDIAQPLGVVLRAVAAHYHLGHVHSSRIITHGYDDLNVLLVCERGRFVVKLFNKAKSIATIADHVRVQVALSRRHAPVPRILVPNGSGIYQVLGQERETYLCVSEFCEGTDFMQSSPQRADILAIARFLAALHRLPLQVAHTYDSWGTLNLPQEFQQKQPFVSDETVRLVAPLADAMAAISFGNARRRVIHGDLQRKHVLKTGSSQYCVLDFGCMDYSYPVVDLGIFLALFCLEGIAPAHAQGVIDDVLAAYRAGASLPDRHIALLGTLIRATWASYLLAADVRLRQGDRSQQTRQWYRMAHTSLRAYERWG